MYSASGVHGYLGRVSTHNRRVSMHNRRRIVGGGVGMLVFVHL